jgi:hypothetical protein
MTSNDCPGCRDIVALSFPFTTDAYEGTDPSQDRPPTHYAIDREGCGTTPDPLVITYCPVCGKKLPALTERHRP